MLRLDEKLGTQTLLINPTNQSSYLLRSLKFMDGKSLLDEAKKNSTEYLVLVRDKIPIIALGLSIHKVSMSSASRDVNCIR